MELVKLGGAALVDGLRYIGLDMFPDVFRSLGDQTFEPAPPVCSAIIAAMCWSPQGSVTSRCISPNTGGRRARAGTA